MAFMQLLRLMQAGDPLTAAGVRGPLTTLEQNVNYLYEWLVAAGVGATVYAHRQAVEADTQVGTPVWFNAANGRFEQGLATLSVDRLSGIIATSPQSQIWGIVANKTAATVADILLYGLDTIDISNAVEGGVVGAGVYYLSGTAPGTLTLNKPPQSVAVLRTTGDGRVFVMPQFIDFLDKHVHFRFDLICRPAGQAVPPHFGSRHTIAVPDPDQPGWLPAGHTVFAGNAPEGAVFGYNLSQHTSLKNAWPPLPVGNAYLEVDRALDPTIGFTGVPLGRDGLCIVDRNGLWWMSDCYGDVPWPTDLDTALPSSASASLSDSESDTPECPRSLTMAMTLWFTKVTFATDKTVVTSLRSRDPRVQIFCAGTNIPGSAGDLDLALNLNFSLGDNALGFLALKEFNPKTGQFLRGPVVEGIYTDDSQVQLASENTATRTIDDVDYVTYQGLVKLTVQPADQLELPVRLVRLGGCEEETFEGVLYLGFIQDEPRSYRAAIDVPTTLTLPNPRLALRFSILGRASGTLPQLTFSYVRVPRPADGLTTPLTLPLTSDEVSLSCDTTAILTGVNQYVEAQSEPFAVAAGDTVYFTVQRDGDDLYDAEVGVLRQVGYLTKGS